MLRRGVLGRVGGQMRVVVLALFMALAGGGIAPAQTLDPETALDTCLNGAEDDSDAVVTACSVALERTDLSPAGMGVLHQRRGTAAFQKGAFGSAVYDFNEAVRLDPKSDAAFAGRGLTYYTLEQYAQAIRDLSAALELNPQHSFAQSIRGICYVRIDSYQAAVDDLTAVLDSKRGGTPMDSYYRGLAYLGLGDKAKARADLKQCLAQVPDQSSCKQALSQIR